MKTGKLMSPSELQQTVRQLARLVEISVTLNSTLDTRQLLRYIIQVAADILGCEATSILLYDEKRSELIFTAASGTDPDKLAEIPVPIENSIAGTVFSTNKPLVINDVEKDPRHYSQVGEQIQFRPRSLLAVPMRIQEHVTGVLEALNKQEGSFNDADINILSVIASQAAVAIHNAQLVNALQEANAELRQVDKIKSDFMAIASHELRTPLGVILGYATFLQEEAQGEMSEHATMVLNSAVKMRTLLEDMTNMNMLQMGATKLSRQRVSAQEVIQSACREAAATAEAKSQALNVHLPAKDLFVDADREKMQLVLENLLNNAVRFTPNGGEITVSAKALHQEIWIEVKDSGIGIEQEYLGRIFEQFYQVEDHLTRHYGGLGLGLAIAKGIVELHGGRIWAESEGKDKGASFNIALPREKVSER
ncbi:MAG: ATP-binding protein [Chloroflexota bacterium]